MVGPGVRRWMYGAGQAPGGGPRGLRRRLASWGDALQAVPRMPFATELRGSHRQKMKLTLLLNQATCCHKYDHMHALHCGGGRATATAGSGYATWCVQLMWATHEQSHAWQCWHWSSTNHANNSCEGWASQKDARVARRRHAAPPPALPSSPSRHCGPDRCIVAKFGIHQTRLGSPGRGARANVVETGCAAPLWWQQPAATLLLAARER